jgi:hypothetical protein
MGSGRRVPQGGVGMVTGNFSFMVQFGIGSTIFLVDLELSAARRHMDSLKMVFTPAE